MAADLLLGLVVSDRGCPLVTLANGLATMRMTRGG